MATIVFTALGTALGGPLGGALGALVGNRIDRAILGRGLHEGPRLKELTATTSSYGTPIARHFGTMRVAGTVIWATDLIETSQRSGGGKGRPATTTYSYSANLAVALSSRPLLGLGRIWADGNLLRGAGGDLKVAGQLRFYPGHGDQAPDPLLAAAEGAACPAFRGTAYCVFENLQLGEFGNRIPALSFEIFADPGVVRLADLAAPIAVGPAGGPHLQGLEGFSDEGGPLADSLGTIDRLFPLVCTVEAAGARIEQAAPDPARAVLLPEAVPEPEGNEGGSGQADPTGVRRSRHTGLRAAPASLRHYDPLRDYQPGIQRAAGRPDPGREDMLEFPGALSASTARQLIEAAALRAQAGRDRLWWRISEIDPRLSPGAYVRAPGHAGLWQIRRWAWRESGIELELQREMAAAPGPVAADSGRGLPAVDLAPAPSLLLAFELPWDGSGDPDARRVHAALSSATPGWAGAMVLADRDGALVPLEPGGRQRCVMGALSMPLGPANPLVFDRGHAIEVQLVAEDLVLASATVGDVLRGANRAMVNGEVIQFVSAQPLGQGRWRLTGLMRGQFGTESAALAGHASGVPFVLLDERLRRYEGEPLGAAQQLAAIGIADPSPVLAPVIASGASRRPLAPVHPRIIRHADQGVELVWKRRSRGSWWWQGTVEPPLIEQGERYEIGLGPTGLPLIAWEVSTPSLLIPGTQIAQMANLHGDQPLWVRQIGTHARSQALILASRFELLV